MAQTTMLRLEYDGTDFLGWARQPGLRTVQGTVEAAVARLLGDRPVELAVAGRTDKGVHAWGQVASYREAPVRLAGLNALLPGDIAALACEPAPAGFDARRDALTRTYCYRLLARTAPSAFERRHSLHWPYALDRDALHACAACLPGVHDFTAFTRTETDHVHFRRRVRSAQWRDHGDVLEFWIEADAFMRNMNRVLVGTMLEVAGGRRSVDGFAALLAGRSRTAAGPTAPPHGLYFVGARYNAAPRPR